MFHTPPGAVTEGGPSLARLLGRKKMKKAVLQIMAVKAFEEGASTHPEPPGERGGERGREGGGRQGGGGGGGGEGEPLREFIEEPRSMTGSVVKSTVM